MCCVNNVQCGGCRWACKPTTWGGKVAALHHLLKKVHLTHHLPAVQCGCPTNAAGGHAAHPLLHSWAPDVWLPGELVATGTGRRNG